MGGNIIVREGETARDDIVAVGGNVRIDGRATRDVVVVGGRLVINGEVERNVSCVGGTLVLGPRARVGRDVVVVGGRLERADSARIGGEFVNVSFGPGVGNLFGPMSWGLGNWWGFTPFAWMLRTTQLFYWLLLALLAVALVGDRVSSASHAIAREPLRMAAIGVVSVFALCFALLILVVLSFLVIGIPFLIALLFVSWLAYIFGAVAVFQAVGNRVMNLVGRPEASQIAIVLAGALVIGILRYMPILGGPLWLIVTLVGLGSVFATRFGTGRPWVRPPASPPPAPGGGPGGAPHQPPSGHEPPPAGAGPAGTEPAEAHGGPGAMAYEQPGSHGRISWDEPAGDSGDTGGDDEERG
jgi:hypothetical protein